MVGGIRLKSGTVRVRISSRVLQTLWFVFFDIIIMTVETLTEKTFEQFLKDNLKQMFQYETEDFDYQLYFPCACKITKSCSNIQGRFARQWG